MNPELQDLRDIRLPDPVSWWPPAPGWWLLALLLMTLIVWSLLRARRRRERRRAATAALGALQKINTDAAPDWLRQCQLILRRTALAYFPRQRVARLEGEAWLDFLRDTDADDRLIEALAGNPWRPPQRLQDSDREHLLRACRRWVKGLPELADNGVPHAGRSSGHV